MLRKRPDAFTEDELTAWLEGLVRDRVSESLLLDYKGLLALDRSSDRREAAKDVSGLANAIGGTLIYGIVEERLDDRNVPARDGHGFDCTNDLISRFHQTVNSLLSPHLIDYNVRQIPFGSGSVLIVWVPQSPAKPHLTTGDSHRFYVRSGDQTAPMDEHQIAQAYADRRAIESRTDQFLASPWALGPTLTAPASGPILASLYAALPVLPAGEHTPVPPPTFRRTYRLSAPQWHAAPKGIESDYEWQSADFDLPPRTTFVWPVDYYALHSTGEVVFWEESRLHKTEDTTEAATFQWFPAAEAQRIDHFLRLSRDYLGGIGYSGPVRVLVRPSWTKVSADLSNLRITLRGRPLRYPSDLWQADLTCSYADLASDTVAIVERLVRSLIRYFGIDTLPNRTWQEVKEAIAEGRRYEGAT